MNVSTPDQPVHSRRRRRLTWGVIAAFAVGLAAAVLLPFAPFVPPTESGATGAVLCGVALGWALTAVVMAWATGRRQAWAFVTAAFFLVGGVLLLLFGAPAHRVLDWVWPAALLVLAVWMLRSVRHQRGRLPGWVLYPTASLLVLAAVSGGLETAAEAVDAQGSTVPGRLIDVGGHRLHLRCTGSGSPTVVLEAGGGEMSSNLGLITTAVGRTTRVCAYDRAGRGWSDPASPPPSGSRIAVDLHTLLQRGGVPGPYVLAGHSFGGLYVRSFAARYPSEVAGMVLADSSTAHDSSGASAGSDLLHRAAALLTISARFGLARLVALLPGDELPARFADEVRMSMSRAGTLESTLDEYADAGDAAGQAAKLTTLDGKPLVIVTSGVGNPASWAPDQDRLTSLSADCVHRTVRGIDHQGLVGDKIGAAATTRAILDVVASVRTSTPLARP